MHTRTVSQPAYAKSATAEDGLYWDKKGKSDPDYDVIIIGAGMGGMTAAAMLAHWGKKELVLEARCSQERMQPAATLRGTAVTYPA